jgi:glutamyl-tRNA synthetase
VNSATHIRTRFAPSPTGNVHIGNIRAAIYNWLYARHNGGGFLLRLEDTDRERSTPEAIRTVMEAMEWLGLAFDEPPLHQSQRSAEHRAAAERLVAAGRAYRHRKGEGGEATLFRIPWNAGAAAGIYETGPAELVLHAGAPVRIDRTGVTYSLVSRKGTAAEQTGCLAGFRDLRVLGEAGSELFSLNAHIDELLSGGNGPFELTGAARLVFTRREIRYRDIVKGELAKSLDSMNDFVLVRSDGNPVFHLANVCDDIFQRVTHIIRGDDHVENTFRHILLFEALGTKPPEYAHLPMIVNDQGKPYSKRDGDAYVGDFREHGYLGEALFNYLVLLGWSPGGGENEVMTRRAIVEQFDLSKVKASPAKVDLQKLQWINAAHMASMPRAQYAAALKSVLAKHGLWKEDAGEEYFAEVLRVMGDRIKITTDIVNAAGFFFTEDYPFDEKSVRKRLTREGALDLVSRMCARFRTLQEWKAPALEASLTGLSGELGVNPADLIHPVRVAASGSSVGPGLFEMLEVLGKERVCRRLAAAVERFGNPA